MKELEFVAALNVLEPGYQIARFRIRRSLIQVQLAEMVDVREVTIARLDSGTRIPSLSLFRRVAQILNARIELKIILENVKNTKE